MRAMLLSDLGPIGESSAPLVAADWPDPTPAAGEILIRVSVCGVCHTELDEIEGRMPPSELPVILGHQVIGRVEALGDGADTVGGGDRVGVAWIYSACGRCRFCLGGEENLCEQFRATGRDAHGGYAELMTVPQALRTRSRTALRTLRPRPSCAGGDRIPLPPPDQTGGRAGPGPHRLRGLGTPGAKAGPPPLPPDRCLRVRALRRRAGFRA